MVFVWTEESALNLTQDAQTRRDGAALATRAKWPSLGMDEQALWGLCQGSGKTPYRVVVDKSELAYRCSCPSKKFPCKHTLALLLILAQDQGQFEQASAPDWVTDWLEQRQRRAAKEVAAAIDAGTEGESAAGESAPVESKAQAKRAQARAAKVDEGLAELRLWLRDLVRHGFVNPQTKSYAFWDRMAARLVDAQAGTVARRLRQMASIPLQGKPDWAARLLDEVSRVYLLAESYQRIDTLPPDLQEDLRASIGWATKREELLSLPALRDYWRILGQVVEGDDQLLMRRVWLLGEQTQKAALLLDFTPRRASFAEHYMTGQLYDAELIYYPSAFPQRALLKQTYRVSTPNQESHAAIHGYATVTEMLTAYADALGCNPWLERIPCVLHQMLIAQHAGSWAVYDAESRTLPVKLIGRDESHLWTLLAQSGGHPVTLVGEWDGYDLNVLGVLGSRLSQ